MTQFGPKPVNQGDPRYYETNDEELISMRKEVSHLLSEIDKVQELRPLRHDDLFMVEKALEIQEKVVRMNQGGNRDDTMTLDELRKMRDDIMGERLREESLSHERNASSLMEQGKYSDALNEYKRALELQDEIHDKYQLSRHKDTTRRVNLRQNIADLNALPFYEESMAAQTKAKKAMEEENWDVASAEMQKAVQLQETINRSHRETRYSSMTRLNELQIEMASVSSGSLYSEIQKLIKTANELAQQERLQQAASLFDEARTLQNRLNSTYPDSRYSSAEATREIEASRQTALSFELYEKADELDSRLNELLRGKRFDDAISLIGQVTGAVERLRSEYPLSKHLKELPTLKYSYLTYTRSNLERIHSQVDSMLVKLPTGVLIASTEVSQELFQLIMGSNPSREKNPLLPVESLTIQEAEEFCTRLSWLLGRDVTLPTQKIYLEALGDIRYKPLRQMTWHKENAGDSIKPIKSSQASEEGVYDLLGNVSEIVERDNKVAGETTHIAIGGSYLTPLENMVEIPSEPVEPLGRSRSVGFRFVVLEK